MKKIYFIKALVFLFFNIFEVFIVSPGYLIPKFRELGFLFSQFDHLSLSMPGSSAKACLSAVRYGSKQD